MADYEEFCSLRTNFRSSDVLDLSNVTFFHPTTLLPLAALIKEEEPRTRLPRQPEVRKYLEIATDSTRFERGGWRGRTYLPIVALPDLQDEAESILQYIYRLHDNGRECGGEDAFKYLIGEIVANIYEHSEFSRSWVMAQAYQKSEYMDICFFDNGITINGCFKKHDVGCTNDYEAIVSAINGTSTEGEERGFGLYSNRRIFTEGIQGQILIVSGSGGYQHSLREPHQIYTLGNAYELSGTLISVRIPYPASVVNIYDFLE